MRDEEPRARLSGRTSIVMHRRQGKHASSVASKVAWLAEHASEYPSTIDLVHAMQRAGLVSPKTYWRDVSVERLLELVKR